MAEPARYVVSMAPHQKKTQMCVYVIRVILVLVVISCAQVALMLHVLKTSVFVVLKDGEGNFAMCQVSQVIIYEFYFTKTF